MGAEASAVAVATLIESVRDRVRARPAGRITLEDVAAQSDFSPVRLHQLFAERCKENFGAFVRRVRLEYACGLMRACPDWSCTRIALEAGFSESSDFTRSFKRAFGLAPSKWDRVSPLSLLNNRAATSETSTYPIVPDRERSPVTIRSFAARRVCVMAVRNATDFAVLRAAFDRLDAWLDARNQRRDTRRKMGLSYDSDLDTPPDVYRYELAHEVDATVLGDHDVIIRDLPATDAAVLACRGGVTEFTAAWDHLARGFLPNSGWRQGTAPAMEIYFNDPRQTDMRFWDMECVLPVERRTTSYG